MWSILTGFLRKNRVSPPMRGTSPSKGSITTLNTPWIYGNTGQNNSFTCRHVSRKLNKNSSSNIPQQWSLHTWEAGNSITAWLCTCQPHPSSFYGNCWDYSIWGGLVVLFDKQNATENPSGKQSKFIFQHKHFNWRLISVMKICNTQAFITENTQNTL